MHLPFGFFLECLECLGCLWCSLGSLRISSRRPWTSLGHLGLVWVLIHSSTNCTSLFEQVGSSPQPACRIRLLNSAADPKNPNCFAKVAHGPQLTTHLHSRPQRGPKKKKKKNKKKRRSKRRRKGGHKKGETTIKRRKKNN